MIRLHYSKTGLNFDFPLIQMFVYTYMLGKKSNIKLGVKLSGSLRYTILPSPTRKGDSTRVIYI